MTTTHNKPEATTRGAHTLRTALAAAIARYLEDPAVVEVMLNPEGRIWIDRLSEGLAGERIVAQVHARSRVSAELPETGERFEGLLPPVVAAPTCKPAVAVLTLDDYMTANIMSTDQETLGAAAASCANILATGGTSTGKTTLTNTLLAEVAKSADRVVITEDTRELQCAAPNLVAMCLKDSVATLSDLVRSSPHLQPDHVTVGEVRGSEALDLLKAWGPGHPGGVGTIHVGSGIGAPRRLEQLIQEAVVIVPRTLIIDLVAVLAGRGSSRQLVEAEFVYRTQNKPVTAVARNRSPFAGRTREKGAAKLW